MTSHFGLMVIFSLFVSIVFATLMRDEPRQQLTFAGRLFIGFVGAGTLIGWLLYPLPAVTPAMIEIQGSRSAAGFRFAIVVSRFNAEITEGLLKGACAALKDAQVRDEDITIVRVPGAFEIPATAQQLAGSKRFDAVVCLGCVIKGDTMHFEYIASAVSQGIMNAGVATEVPVAFGVLTTLTDEQAAARAAGGPDNKGREAALAAVEMATLSRRIGEAGLQ